MIYEKTYASAEYEPKQIAEKIYMLEEAIKKIGVDTALYVLNGGIVALTEGVSMNTPDTQLIPFTDVVNGSQDNKVIQVGAPVYFIKGEIDAIIKTIDTDRQNFTVTVQSSRKGSTGTSAPIALIYSGLTETDNLASGTVLEGTYNPSLFNRVPISGENCVCFVQDTTDGRVYVCNTTVNTATRQLTIQGTPIDNPITGKGIDNINTISHKVVGTETVTDLQVSYTNGDVGMLEVHAQNGKDGITPPTPILYTHCLAIEVSDTSGGTGLVFTINIVRYDFIATRIETENLDTRLPESYIPCVGLISGSTSLFLLYEFRPESQGQYTANIVNMSTGEKNNIGGDIVSCVDAVYPS